MDKKVFKPSKNLSKKISTVFSKNLKFSFYKKSLQKNKNSPKMPKIIKTKIHAQKDEWEGKNSKQSLNHSIFPLSFGMEIIVTVVDVIVEWVWNQKGTVHHRQATGTSDKMKKFATISDFFPFVHTQLLHTRVHWFENFLFFLLSPSCRYIFNLIESSLIGKIASFFFVKATAKFSE